MGAHEDTVRILETELGQVEQAFRGLSATQWQTPTRLLPVDEAKPPWTLFELAGHFDISIGLTVMLMAEPQDGHAGRDRVSFFIFARSEVAPVVYDYAYTMVEGKSPEQMADVLAATFAKTVDGARSPRWKSSSTPLSASSLKRAIDASRLGRKSPDSRSPPVAPA